MSHSKLYIINHVIPKNMVKKAFKIKKKYGIEIVGG